MKTRTIWVLPVLLLVVGSPGYSAESGEEQVAAIAAIKGLGGDVRFDRNRVVETVNLDRSRITDGGLVYLKALPTVQTLSMRFTQVTGAGFVHLKGLTKLTTLYLPGSTVGDIGLEHFKNVPTLVNLYLQETKITDAGLEHLSGLANLRTLYVSKTKITDAGLAHLQPLRLDRDLARGDGPGEWPRFGAMAPRLRPSPLDPSISPLSV